MCALKKCEVVVLMAGWVKLRTFGQHDSNEASLGSKEGKKINQRQKLKMKSCKSPRLIQYFLPQCNKL